MLRLTRAGMRDTLTDDLRAMRMSNAGRGIGLAVSMNALDPSALVEAVQLHRESVRLTNASHPRHLLYLVNLGDRLNQAVDSGILNYFETLQTVESLRNALSSASPDDLLYEAGNHHLGQMLANGVRGGHLQPLLLLESLDSLERALSSLPGNHPKRPSALAALASRVEQAVQAGLIPDRHLLRSIELLREAALIATEGEKPEYLTSLALAINSACMTGLLGIESLGEALDLQREALRRAGPSGERGPSLMSNVALAISNSVRGNDLPASSLLEAIELQRIAVHRTPASEHIDYYTFRANLAGYLAEAVRLGVADSAVLPEAIETLRETVTSLPPYHPHKPGQMSNLAVALAVASDARVISGSDAAAEIIDLVDQVWRSLRFYAVSPTARRAVLRDVRGLIGTAPWALLNSGRKHAAVEAASAIEALRGHLLRGLHAPALPTGAQLSPEAVEQYSAVKRAYDASQRRAIEHMDDYTESYSVSSALSDAIDEIRRNFPEMAAFGTIPAVETLSALLPMNSVGIYLIPGPRSGAAVVVWPNAEVMTVPLPYLTLDAVKSRTQQLNTPCG